jgi:hypothetical protein
VDMIYLPQTTCACNDACSSFWFRCLDDGVSSVTVQSEQFAPHLYTQAWWNRNK